MSSKAITDTNILVGFFDQNDVWHSKAAELMTKENIEGVFLDCVLNEVFTVLCRRAQERKDGERFEGVIERVKHSVPEDRIIWTYLDIRYYYAEVISLMEGHEGKLNFHDCLIALVAKQKGIKTIVSFDKDFDRIPWLERVG